MHMTSTVLSSLSVFLVSNLLIQFCAKEAISTPCVKKELLIFFFSLLFSTILVFLCLFTSPSNLARNLSVNIVLIISLFFSVCLSSLFLLLSFSPTCSPAPPLHSFSPLISLFLFLLWLSSGTRLPGSTSSAIQQLCDLGSVS